MHMFRKLISHFKVPSALATMALVTIVLTPTPASATTRSSGSVSHRGTAASPTFWAGTNCYDLISAQWDWAQFCVSVNVSDWTEAKQALVTFQSYSGNFKFVRIDGLELNRNEGIIQRSYYTQEYLNSSSGYFGTNWSYTYLGNYSAAVNTPCVIWQNNDWACADPTWYESATESIL